ncbi:MAG: dihydroneopterin aldolase [Bacteroidales bacterium]|nr:dihydroneopterin aldolase [Bacteroidales bacterium]
MAVIQLEDMRFYAFHGCFEEERAIGTHFRVDAWIETDTEKAQHSDCLDDTVNYLSVYQSIKKEMEQPSKLLENVAERMASTILNLYPAVDKVRIKVSKLNPPLGGHLGAVSVSIDKAR